MGVPGLKSKLGEYHLKYRSCSWFAGELASGYKMIHAETRSLAGGAQVFPGVVQIVGKMRMTNHDNPCNTEVCIFAQPRRTLKIQQYSTAVAIAATEICIQHLQPCIPFPLAFFSIDGFQGLSPRDLCRGRRLQRGWVWRCRGPSSAGGWRWGQSWPPKQPWPAPSKVLSYSILAGRPDGLEALIDGFFWCHSAATTVGLGLYFSCFNWTVHPNLPNMSCSYGNRIDKIWTLRIDQWTSVNLDSGAIARGSGACQSPGVQRCRQPDPRS